MVETPREFLAEPPRLPTDRRLLAPAGLVDEFLGTTGDVGVVGLAGSAGVRVGLALARRLAAPVLYVTPDAETAVQALADATFFEPEFKTPSSLCVLPPEEAPWAEVHPDRRQTQQRLSALCRLALGQSAGLVITTGAALVRRFAPAAHLRLHTFTIQVGDSLCIESLLTRLIRGGYLRTPLVEDPGTVAVRGGLVDLWSVAHPFPLRIELEGERVARLRRYSPDDQRSAGEEPSVVVTLSREVFLDDDAEQRASGRLRDCADAVNWPSSKARTLIEEVLSGRPFPGYEGYLPAFFDMVGLLDYLPSSSPVVLEDVTAVLAAIRAEHEECLEAYERRKATVQFSPALLLMDETAIAGALKERRVLSLSRVGQSGSDPEDALGWLASVSPEAPTLGADDCRRLAEAGAHARRHGGHLAGLEPVSTQLSVWAEAALDVCIVSRAQTQLDRLSSLLSHRGHKPSRQLEGPVRDASGQPRPRLVTGTLGRGVVLPGEGRAFVTEEEIFGSRSHRKPARERRPEDWVEDLRSLMPGDFVVHVEHGIGRYLGLERQKVGPTTIELLAIEYSGGRLYLPVYRLNQIAKYSGQDAVPRLDRLGGSTFAKTRAKVEQRVRQMADELLRLYADRLVVERPPLGPPTDDDDAFDASFPFEETADQAAAIAEVLTDLQGTKAMDRLVCGDVGFGKTEVALRAAFRVAMAAHQVAVLCPTTVLCQQHFLTFQTRLSAWGVEVRALSRFTKPLEVKQTLLGLSRGTVDVVIGTHRLLSKDVHFRNLRLLVVDEEQRFGVTHKERIKQLRSQVDVITLSATPIPRTLQMAVGGLRDLSLIATPPVDRRAIRTILGRLDPDLIAEAIRRELHRGGQVFYVHNRVAGLDQRAAQLAALVPEARLGLAHGQMPEARLERAMVDFVNGRTDILVCTAIIENGLDIPRANTLIVDRADLFGLSQLYQLRGRVGRSKERAYCYLLVPSLGELSEETRSRLEAIERFTELGSGMRIAALDLELRGGGDLLGAEQSGFVGQVGLELFCEMLRSAADQARGIPHVEAVEPELGFDVPGWLPEEYIEDVPLRLSLYKRLAQAQTPEHVDELAFSMQDRFGPPPLEARHFIAIMREKPRLRRLAVLGCDASIERVTLHLRHDTPLEPSRISELVTRQSGRYRLFPDGRLTRSRGPEESFETGIEHLGCLLDELEGLLVTN